MPGGVLVIGVGGAGRGIVNHLKWRLEESHGSAQDAGVVLYVFDGPEKDQFNEVPGGFQIDKSPNSPEKYKFATNPTQTLEDIGNGKIVPYISDWLDAADAARTPKAGIAPETGFGGVRIPGRVTLFLEPDLLNSKLESLVRNTVQDFQTAQRNNEYADIARELQKENAAASITVFVCGSQSGGTGAGLFTDIAYLVHELVSHHNGRVVGVVALPSAFAEFKAGDDRLQVRANGIGGLREIIRSQATRVPYQAIYNNGITVNGKQLFHICYLVDGGQKYCGADPRTYLYPAAADLILAHVEDRKDIYPRLPDRINQLSSARSVERFSSFGIHDLVYSPRDVAESLSYRFAQDVLEWIGQMDPSDPFDGANEARAFLTGFSRFTAMAYQPEPPLAPPPEQNRFTELGMSFEKGPTGARYPYFPCMDLVTTVKYARSIFTRSITNQMVKTTADTCIENYIGTPGSPLGNRTIAGWLAQQEGVFLQHYEAALVQTLAKIFYEQRDGQMVPKSWRHRGTLAKAERFIQEVITSLSHLKIAIDSTYAKYKGPSGSASASLVAKADMDNVFKGKKPTGVDRAAQEKYLQKGNTYLRVRLWELFITTAGSLIGRIIESSERLSSKLGASAEGWLHLIAQNLDDARSYETNKANQRSELARIVTRTYLPLPSGRDEQMLYEEEVCNPFLNDYLSNCSWLLGNDCENQEKIDVSSFCIYSQTPAAPGFQSVEFQRKIRTLHDNRVASRVLHNFTWQETAAYIRSQIRPVLEQKTVWEILALDFEHNFCTSPLQRNVGASQQLQNYVQETCDRITAGAGFDLFASQAAGVKTSREYCVSSFQASPNPMTTKDSIAAAFYQELNRRQVTLNPDPRQNHHIVFLKIREGVDVRTWTNLDNTVKDYYKVIREHRLPSPTLFWNERNANEIESDLAALKRLAIPVWLSPELIALLPHKDEFRSVVLCYAFDLLAKGEEKWNGMGVPTTQVMGIPGSGGIPPLWIAPQWQWGEFLLKLFFDPGYRDDSKKLIDLWEDYYNTNMRGKSADQIKGMFEEKIKSLTILTPDGIAANAADFLDHDELLEVMRSVLRTYCKLITMGKTGGGAP